MPPIPHQYFARCPSNSWSLLAVSKSGIWHSCFVRTAARSEVSHGVAAEHEDYLLAHRSGLELAYSLEQNEFRGERVTELTVADVRMPAEV